MKFIKELGDATDIMLLARAAHHKEVHSAVNSNGYDSLALSIDRRVQKGDLDPIKAEAALADYHVQDSENFADTPKGERYARALARLADKGIVDPIFALDVLDGDFTRWSILNAIQQATKK